MAKKASFEDELRKLGTITQKLENGDIPLDEAMKQFKSGMELGTKLENKLKNAKRTLTKVATPNGGEKPYGRDKNGKDINESVGNDNVSQTNVKSNSSSQTNSTQSNTNQNSNGQIDNPFTM